MQQILTYFQSPGLFMIDPLAMVMGSLIGVVVCVVLGFSRRYMDGDRQKGRYMINVLALAAGALGMVFADHIYAFLACWGISNLLLVRLMIHKKEWAAAKNAGLFALGNFASGFVLLAVGLFLLSDHSGSNHIHEIVSIYSANQDRHFTSGLLALALAAMTQSAAYPFHRWLLSSLNSPTPVSALMHAGLVNGGGFLLVRFAPLYIDQPKHLLALFIIGLVTAVLGTFWKLIQTDIKRMLACSTMGQMGFMLMQCGMGLFAAAISHLVWHGLFKAYLFLNAGSVVQEKRQKDIFTQIKPPVFALACLIGVFGIAGFSVVIGQDITAVDTSLIMIGFAYMTATQIACRVLVGGLNPASLSASAILSMLSGLIYGGSIRLIEYVLAPLPIMLPQPLNSLYIFGFTVTLFVWLAMNLDVLRRIESSAFWKALYVRALNASQPHPTTITSIRTTYKA